MSKRDTMIAPSILAADFSKLGDEILRVRKMGFKRLHIDIMDGVFVPNISIGPNVVKCLVPYKGEMFFDVHLMITNPREYLDDFINAGADGITIHLESNSDTLDCINYLKTKGIKTGISINPETSIDSVEKYAKYVDYILIMTVHPGFGGQSFIESSLDRIRELRAYLDDNDLNDVYICVDGGINDVYAPLASEAGASVLVSGTWIFRNPSIEQVLKELKLNAI